MSTTLAVLVARSSFYRTLGPIIDAALTRSDFEVEIVLMAAEAGEAKAYLAATRDNVPERLVNRCRVTLCADMAEAASRLACADVVLSIVGRSAALRDSASVTANTLWCAVFDADHSVFPQHGFGDAELLAWPTRRYRQWLEDMGSVDGVTIAARSCEVGYLRSDQMELASRETIRDLWRLRADRPVVLYIPDTMRLRPKFSHASDWYRHVWCVDGKSHRLARALLYRRTTAAVADALGDAGSDVDLLLAIRRFCDRQGAQLVLASRREKECAGRQRFTRTELRVADAIVTEDSIYPQTLPRAIKMADLVVCGYLSGAVLDGLAAGVPFVTVGFPDRAYRTEFLPLLTRMKEQANWPGATWEIPVQELVERFDRMALSEFAIRPDVLAHARALYVGSVDGQCGQRLLDEIQRRMPLGSSSVPADITTYG